MVIAIMLAGQQGYSEFFTFIQINLFLLSTYIILFYTAFFKPYKDIYMNYQDITNECLVVITAYHLFCFTMWIPENEVRYLVGKSMIGVIITGVAFNFVILVFAEIKLIHHLYTKFKLKANQKIRMIQAHNEEKRRQKYNLKLNKMFNGDSANNNQDKSTTATPLQNIIKEAPSEMEESNDDDQSDNL